MAQEDIAPVNVLDREEALDVPWNVFLWNDPVTPMNVVTLALKKIFGYPKEKSEQLMLEAHHNGKVVVWTGEQSLAQGFCIQLHTCGLQATIAKDS